jgi:ketosteroid isomerase-like protein
VTNAERLDALYDRFWNRHDWHAGADIMAPDVEWVGMAEDPDLGGIRHGPRAVNKYFAEWLEAWQIANVGWEMHELTPDLVLVHTRLRTRGRVSGIEAETEVGQVWEFRDGMVVRQTLYRTYDEARQAAEALVG